jgi:hypothetical protein
MMFIQILPIPLREPLIFGGSPSLNRYFLPYFQVQWSSFPVNILLLGRFPLLHFSLWFHVLRFANPIGQSVNLTAEVPSFQRQSAEQAPNPPPTMSVRHIRIWRTLFSPAPRFPAANPGDRGGRPGPANHRTLLVNETLICTFFSGGGDHVGIGPISYLREGTSAHRCGDCRARWEWRGGRHWMSVHDGASDVGHGPQARQFAPPQRLQSAPALLGVVGCARRCPALQSSRSSLEMLQVRNPSSCWQFPLHTTERQL